MGGSTEASEISRQAHAWGRAYTGKRLAILGAGPVGADILRCLRGQGGQVVGVMDDFTAPDSRLEDCRVVPSRALLSLQADAVILATTKARQRMRDRLEQLGYAGDILCLPGEDDDVFAPSRGQRVCEIEQFHNLHAGQRAFVVGNGPSLKRTDPRRLGSEVTFGCNSIFLLEDFVPTYYCLENHICAEDRQEQINALPWAKFLSHDLRRWLTNGHFFNAFRTAEIDTFSTDFAAGIQVGATVTYTMIQLAFYMGCDPVYLVGMDHSYNLESLQKDPGKAMLISTGDDANHFHVGCIGKGFRANYPHMDRMETAYRLAREAFEKHGRRIYNATAGGKLEIFERINFERLLR